MIAAKIADAVSICSEMVRKLLKRKIVMSTGAASTEYRTVVRIMAEVMRMTVR